MEKQSPLRTKSYNFAVRIIKLSRYLQKEKQEYILAKQILRSGTAIGALIMEAEYAQSNADYINKFSVSLKEANETSYWLSLLKDTDYISEEMYVGIHAECKELIAMLVSAIKTLKLKDKN